MILLTKTQLKKLHDEGQVAIRFPAAYAHKVMRGQMLHFNNVASTDTAGLVTKCAHPSYLSDGIKWLEKNEIGYDVMSLQTFIDLM